MRKAKIKDLCSFLPKSKIKAGEGLEKGKYIFFTSSDIKTMCLNEYLFDEEALILGTGGKPSCNYFNGKFAVSTDNFVLKSDKINIKYLYYFLRNNNLSVLEHGFHGAGLKHISKDYVNDIEIPVLDECYQLNIINNLDLINQSIDFCKNQLIKYDELVKSQFIEMFENDDSLIGDLIDYCIYQEGPGVRSVDFRDEGTIFLTGSNINNNEITFGHKSDRFISDELAEGKYRHFIVDVNDILVVSSAISPEKFDEKVVITKEDKKYCLNTGIIRFKPNQKYLTNEYFMEFLKSDFFKRQVMVSMKGIAQLHFGPSHLKKMKVLIPSSIDKQNKFSSFVQQIDKSKFIVQKQIKLLEELLEKKMNEYFGQ